jgi:hypothetical protein
MTVTNARVSPDSFPAEQTGRRIPSFEALQEVLPDGPVTMSRTRAAAVRDSLQELTEPTASFRGPLAELRETLDLDLNALTDRRRRIVLGSRHVAALAVYHETFGASSEDVSTEAKFRKLYGLKVIPLSEE